MTYETIKVSDDLRIRIERDTDAESPAEWDNVGNITYRKGCRYVLGTEEVSEDRYHDIIQGIEDGSLIGLPVYAYVHGGATIRAGRAFNDPWDSGRSGVVYCTKAKAIKEFGKKIATQAVIEKTLKSLECEVEAFDMWLTGDVYGYIIERSSGDEWLHVDSCWGCFGLDYCIEIAKEAAAQCTEEVGDVHEARTH
jgi:hypothetical protein